MSDRVRGLAIAFVSLVLAGSTVAEEPIPPLPLSSKQRDVSPDSALPEVHSPCTFDLDAGWLAPLRNGHNETLKLKVPKPINCDGAVLEFISATGLGSVTRLQFTVALRPGVDRHGIVSFGILDDDKQLITVGEASDNLDEGKVSYLIGILTIKNREFERVFAEGRRPVMRVTLRVSDN